MTPIVNRLKGEYGKDMEFKAINVSKSSGKDLARNYGVIGQPTFIIFDRSGEQVKKLIGAQDRAVFVHEIERILGE